MQNARSSMFDVTLNQASTTVKYFSWLEFIKIASSQAKTFYQDIFLKTRFSQEDLK